MNSTRPLIIAVGLILGGQLAFAQDVSRYRAYARTAVREAVRLDALEAPRREAAQRKQEAGEASAARDKTRIANKAAFRP